MICMRKLPRPFKMPFGKGKIIEEVSILCKHHEPTIQILSFDSGEKILRFCYYNGNRFGRSPLMISENDWKRLKKAAKQCKEINSILNKD